MTDTDTKPDEGDLTTEVRTLIRRAETRIEHLSMERITSLKGGATEAETSAWRQAHPYPGSPEDAAAAAVVAWHEARVASLLADVAEARAAVEAALAERNDWMARAIDRGQLVINIREAVEDVLERTEWNDWPGQRRLEDRVRGALLYTDGGS